MYKPKSTREIYIESLSINSASIEKQLADESVLLEEIRSIVDFVSKMYRENVDRIVSLCDNDMMALEYVPSPLKLFVDCLAQAQKSLSVSSPASKLIQQYTSAWEDWM
ncbi:MAG: hypothetical protein M3251_03690 [Thermoproteota archaeon]|jgi:hypothetical protein|nr:hypothetical protein [Thermoproteota archaeon]